MVRGEDHRTLRGNALGILDGQPAVEGRASGGAKGRSQR
jgi:hypothetical protein